MSIVNTLHQRKLNLHARSIILPDGIQTRNINASSRIIPADTDPVYRTNKAM